MKTKAKEHYRNADGDIILSVTTILNELNKPALVRWANKLGLQGIDSNKYKDELADIGTLTHYLIMCRLHEVMPEVDDYSPVQVEMAQACYQKYVDWESKNPVKPVLVEEKLVSERYQFGGQPDMYAYCLGDLILGDFKTNAKGIFPEMIYQVAAYAYLLEENGYRVSKAVVLRLGRSDPEGFEEKILTKAELHVGLQIFLRTNDICRLKRGLEPICTKVI